jgi:hypothetical protein
MLTIDFKTLRRGVVRSELAFGGKLALLGEIVKSGLRRRAVVTF